ncbi:MAG TPA: pitrilysin family protein [Candidatus Paceibacterota bacterium]|nr:pitrilysin family protein [Candidatus Paceibacterota bacterium]
MTHPISDPYTTFLKATLSNGLTVFFSEVNHPWIKLKVLVHAGAKDDVLGSEGTAHFVEHLVSHNVAGKTHQEAEEHFDEIGGYARFGSTSYESTSYSFGVPLENDNLAFGLNFFGEMLLTSTLDNFVERERKIIMGEYQERFPVPISVDLLLRRRKHFFGEHRLGHYLRPLGRASSISSMTHEMLREFYRKNYTPKNISIVASGGMTLDEFVQALESSKFAVVKEGERIPTPLALKEINPDDERHYNIPWPEIYKEKPHQASVLLCQTFPGTISDVAVSRALNVLSDALYKEIREERGWSYSVSTNVGWFPEAHEIAVDIDFPWEHLGELEDVVDVCVETAINDVTSIERHIRRSINRFKIRDPNIGDIVSGASGDVERYGRVRTYDDELADLAKVRVEEVQDILRSFVRAKRYTMIFGE